jgi:hypothetical protein
MEWMVLCFIVGSLPCFLLLVGNNAVMSSGKNKKDENIKRTGREESKGGAPVVVMNMCAGVCPPAHTCT